MHEDPIPTADDFATGLAYANEACLESMDWTDAADRCQAFKIQDSRGFIASSDLTDREALRDPTLGRTIYFAKNKSPTSDPNRSK